MIALDFYDIFKRSTLLPDSLNFKNSLLVITRLSYINYMFVSMQ